MDKPDLAERLEQLRRNDKLIIYLCENKEIHSKFYLLKLPNKDQTDEEAGDDQMAFGGEANGEGVVRESDSKCSN